MFVLTWKSGLCWMPGVSLVNIGVTACLYGLSVGVMTEGYSDKKCFYIKCLVTYGVCKTLEPNKSPRANPYKTRISALQQEN